MPAYDYRTPKVWKAGEALSPAKLNTYIGEQNDFLRYRNRVRTLSTTGYNIAATSLTLVADNEFRHLIDVKQNEDIMVYIDVTFTLNTITQATFYDLFIDDTYYLSSGTATPLIRGSFSAYAHEVSQPENVKFKRLITGLAAGEHSISLHAARGSGTFIFVKCEMITEGY